MRFVMWTLKVVLALVVASCLFNLAGRDIAYALVLSVYSGLDDPIAAVLLSFVTAFGLILALVVASYYISWIVWRRLR
jgi:hypothetical protein